MIFPRNKKIVSFSLSIMIWALWVWFILWLAYKWWSSWRTPVQIVYTKQLFDGTKYTNKARFNVVKYLMQRFIFWMIAALCNSDGYLIKIIVYCFIQFWCFLYVVLVRPFQEFKDNLLEFIIEIHYLALWLFLIYLNSQERWTTIFEIIYICIIISNNILFALFSLIFAIKAIIVRFCCSKKSNQSNNVEGTTLSFVLI